MAGLILRNVQDLYKKLPSDSDTDKLITDVEAKIEPVFEAYHEAVKSPDILIANPTVNGGVELASTSAERVSAALRNAVNDLSGHVLTKAQAVREKAEEEFAIYTWTSYFLYAFGWGLGLIGRLVGLELGGE